MECELGRSGIIMLPEWPPRLWSLWVCRSDKKFGGYSACRHIFGQNGWNHISHSFCFRSMQKRNFWALSCYDMSCPVVEFNHSRRKEPFSKLRMYVVIKAAKNRNWYNQVPHLTQDTTWESDKNTIKHHTEEPGGQPFPSRWPQDKTAMTTRESMTNTRHK